MRSCQNINDEYKQEKKPMNFFLDARLIRPMYFTPLRAMQIDVCLSIGPITLSKFAANTATTEFGFMFGLCCVPERAIRSFTPKTVRLRFKAKKQKIIHKSWIICVEIYSFIHTQYIDVFLGRCDFVWHVPKLFHNGAINRQDEFQVQKTIPRTK